MTVALCIATHNRKDDLIRTLRVVDELDPPPDEVLITADGCTDDTVAFLREKYPSHRLTVNATSLGSTASRDAMFRAATSDVVLILDDDSYPIEREFLGRLAPIFQASPRLAVATFPQRSDEFPASLTAVDFGPPYFTGTYVNCAAAIRRSVFIELGGYPPEFRIAYDEPDFALRCVAAGWQVRYETGLTIRHHYSGAMRNEMRMHHAHARNELWSALMRCPAPQLFPVLLWRAARQFGYAWKRGLQWVRAEPKWWIDFLAGIPRCLAARRPVPWARYFAWMRLARHPIFSQTEWQAIFGKAGSQDQADRTDPLCHEPVKKTASP